MATAINTLYPPVISTYGDTFIYKESPRVYFSLSQYNSVNDIQVVQFSVVNQLNNENATTDSSGILFQSLNFDDKKGMYYIDIPVGQMIGGQFNINQFYKVQVRFDNNKDFKEDLINTPTKKNSYLLNEQDHFSEWSSVCLIRAILYPHLRIKIFDNYTAKGVQALNKGIIPIVGGLYFDEDNDPEQISRNETESLQSYKIELLNEGRSEVLLSTDMIYTGDNLDPNDINYRFDIQTAAVDDEDRLWIRVTVITKDQYTFFKDYEFQIANFENEENFEPIITEKVDNEDGIITVNVKTSQNIIGGVVYVKRLSSIDHFKTATLLRSSYVHGPVNITIQDNTVQPLTWYRYSVQYESVGGVLAPITYSDIVMPDFTDAILSRGNQQYAIRYNYNITAYKPVVNRSHINTLGGKYPKFAENAILDYKQFSINGTMSADADVYQRFLDKDDVYADRMKSYYSTYKLHPHNSIIHNEQVEDYLDPDEIKDVVRNDFQNYKKYDDMSERWTDENAARASNTAQSYLTTTKDDWMWEKEFRESLSAWLNDGEPKLYRSKQEGNLVVILTDVSLSPVQNTARFLYTFSATMYEVAPSDSVETLDSLGIFAIRSVDGSTSGGQETKPDDFVTVEKVGQTYDLVVKDKNDIRNAIMNNLRMIYGYKSTKSDGTEIYDDQNVRGSKKPENLRLRNIKIYFKSEPNLYYLANGDPVWMNKNNLADDMVADQYKDKLMLGYVFSIETSSTSGVSNIFVNDHGFYQVPDYLDVTALSFNHIGDEVSIEYTVVYDEYNSATEITTGSSIARTVVGQHQNIFYPGVYQGNYIRNKYNYLSDNNFRQYMRYWRGICIEATPFALLKIDYQGTTGENEYMIGETGVLHMLKGFNVKDICFLGRRMVKKPKSLQKYLQEWEYCYDDSVNEEVANSKEFNWFTVDPIEETDEPVEIYQDESNAQRRITQQFMPLGKVVTNQKYRRTRDVKKPHYNTVYQINGSLKIYYIDGNWYDFAVIPRDSTNIVGNTATQEIGLARIPIEGAIEYYGSVIQNTFM